MSAYEQTDLLAADDEVPAEAVAWIQQVAGEHANWSSAHIRDYLGGRKHIDVSVAQVREVLGR